MTGYLLEVPGEAPHVPSLFIGTELVAVEAAKSAKPFAWMTAAILAAETLGLRCKVRQVPILARETGVAAANPKNTKPCP